MPVSMITVAKPLPSDSSEARVSAEIVYIDQWACHIRLGVHDRVDRHLITDSLRPARRPAFPSAVVVIWETSIAVTPPPPADIPRGAGRDLVPARLCHLANVVSAGRQSP